MLDKTVETILKNLPFEPWDEGTTDAFIFMQELAAHLEEEVEKGDCSFHDECWFDCLIKLKSFFGRNMTWQFTPAWIEENAMELSILERRYTITQYVDVLSEYLEAPNADRYLLDIQHFAAALLITAVEEYVSSIPKDKVLYDLIFQLAERKAMIAKNRNLFYTGDGEEAWCDLCGDRHDENGDRVELMFDKVLDTVAQRMGLYIANQDVEELWNIAWLCTLISPSFNPIDDIKFTAPETLYSRFFDTLESTKRVGEGNKVSRLTGASTMFHTVAFFIINKGGL